MIAWPAAICDDCYRSIKWIEFAGVAQLVERDVPNVNVEGSNPFARF